MSWGGLNCAALGRTRLSRWLGRVTTENNNVMVRDQTTNRRQTGLQHSTDIRWDCTCTSKSWLQLKWAAYKWNKAQWGPYRSFLLSSAVWQTTYRTNAQIHGVTSICPVRGGRLSVIRLVSMTPLMNLLHQLRSMLIYSRRGNVDPVFNELTYFLWFHYF
jgi:hypothetical protein